MHSGNSVAAHEWRDNPFLADIPSDLLDHLGTWIRREIHTAGDTILHEGAPSDHVYLLTSGRVAVVKGPEQVALGHIEAGGCFGEMGMLSGAPRSTTIVADTDVEIWSIDREAVQRLHAATGADLLALTLKSHAGVLGDNLARASDTAVRWMRERMEEYRIRAAFGTLFTHVILMMFVYISALGALRGLSASGGSSTLTTSALLLATAAGAAWIMKTSGFPPQVFGITLARWRSDLAMSLAWSLAFCTLLTLAKAVLLRASPAHGHLPMWRPWVSPDGLGATVAAYALYAVLSPLQEFVARGMMQGSLARMLTGRHAPLLSILTANAVFSISHQHLGPGYALAVFLPGLFWGWMYHRQGSLLGVSVSHVVIGLWATGMLDLAALVPP